MRRYNALAPAAAVLVALALAAPAAAQTTAATATITGSGTSWVLSVRNTGTQTLQCMRFTAAAGVQVTGASGPGAVAANPNGFAADGIGIAPNASADFAFTTAAPYPDNGGGTLAVSATCASGSDVAAPVTGPAPPGPGPALAPVRGESELLEVISGIVLVRRPGTKGFVRLTKAALLPDRTEVDTTRGRLRVTVDRGDGTTESAEVAEGRAVIDQDKAARPTTTLRLSEPLACGARRAAAAVTAKKRKPKRRKIFTKTKGGRFRTQGRFAAAVATGTTWRTTDTCASTTIQAIEGTVSVTDLRRGRSAPLRAPGRRVVKR